MRSGIIQALHFARLVNALISTSSGGDRTISSEPGGGVEAGLRRRTRVAVALLAVAFSCADGCAGAASVPYPARDAPVVADDGGVRTLDAGDRPATANASREPEPTADGGALADTRCDGDRGGRLAWITCAGDRIDTASTLVFHPERRRPPAPVLRVLRAVARLLVEHQEVLLVRIEVTTSATDASPGARRRATEAAQERADAILRHLFRAEGISAERLEALGRASPGQGSAPRFHATLRIVQRAR